ncbi:MAG: hypothetical protein ACOYN0_02565 [Phycisphaerales bacterium]
MAYDPKDPGTSFVLLDNAATVIERHSGYPFSSRLFAAIFGVFGLVGACGAVLLERPPVRPRSRWDGGRQMNDNGEYE